MKRIASARCTRSSSPAPNNSAFSRIARTPDALTSTNKTTLASRVLGYAKALIELVGDIFPADTGGIANGFRLQDDASQSIDRADIGLGRPGSHRHCN